MLASVDTIFSVLDSAFANGAEIYFRRFVQRSAAIKWMIGADFVINEPTAAHDAFAFTVFPHDADFLSMQAEIERVFPRDIKGTRIINEHMLAYLREPRRFHFCFLVGKNRHARDSLENIRLTIDRAISTIRGWRTKSGDGSQERRMSYLKTFQELRQRANANNFNYKLLSDIGLLSMIGAAIMLWIVRHGEAKVCGIFPDRDKMTLGYNSVFNEMTYINFSALREQFGISENPQIVMPAALLLGAAELFYDPLVRIPDYVAGAISRFDDQAGVMTSDQRKHLDLVEKFVSDNTNLAITQITESMVGLTASSIIVWSQPDRQNLASQMDRQELLEYMVAKSMHFRQPRRRSYRQGLLDHADIRERHAYWFAHLMKGVADGAPGPVATFRRQRVTP